MTRREQQRADALRKTLTAPTMFGSEDSQIEGRSRPQVHPGSPDGPRHEPGAEMPLAALDIRRVA